MEQQPTVQQSKETDTPKTTQTRNAFLLGIVVFVVIVLFGGVQYVRSAVRNLSEQPSVVQMSRTLGLAVATVNGEEILYADYVEDKATLTNFYASEPGAPEITAEQISDQVLVRLVANELISQLAAEADVNVTPDDVEEARTELLTQFEDQAALEAEIMSRYGWDFDTYVERVVSPVILEQKLSEAYIEANTDPAAVRTTAQGVLERILGGEEFEPLAAEFGSDGTRFQGGDLGYFARGVMVPEFEDAVFALEPGTVSSELVETQFGYHIVKVEDKRTTSTPTGDVEEVRARHILFQFGGAEDFIAYMDQQFSTSDIDILLDIHNPFADLAQLEETTDQQ